MTNSIAATVYFGIGLALSYAFVGRPRSGALAAAVFIIVLFPIMRLRSKEQAQLDAQRWTAGATKGTCACVAVILCTLPQVCFVPPADSLPMFLYAWLMGGIFGISVYYHDYLRPLSIHADDEALTKALDLEHREVMSTLQITGTGAIVLFIAVFGSYLLSVLSNAKTLEALNPRQLAYMSLLVVHAFTGAILWLLRPLHARGKEIRIALLATSGKTKEGANDVSTAKAAVRE